MNTVATIQKPTIFPNTNCRYENAVLPTLPGTDIKVTPDSVAPTIPNATKYHGDLRFAVKNACVSAPREVNHEIPIKTRKYPKTIARTKYGFISLKISRKSEVGSPKIIYSKSGYKRYFSRRIMYFFNSGCQLSNISFSFLPSLIC